MPQGMATGPGSRHAVPAPFAVGTRRRESDAGARKRTGSAVRPGHRRDRRHGRGPQAAPARPRAAHRRLRHARRRAGRGHLPRRAAGAVGASPGLPGTGQRPYRGAMDLSQARTGPGRRTRLQPGPRPQRADRAGRGTRPVHCQPGRLAGARRRLPGREGHPLPIPAGHGRRRHGQHRRSLDLRGAAHPARRCRWAAPPRTASSPGTVA